VDLEVRKLQQVGYSTLVVSLPRKWVKEVGLKRGEAISLIQETDGTLRLIPGVSKGEKEYTKLIVDADKITEEGLLTRIITGMYIVGHDALQITSRKGLRNDQSTEIRKACLKMTGINIVEQTLNYITIQNFVDPTRFPVNGLLRRLYIITSAMHDACYHAIKESNKELAVEAINMEQEVNRIYWLVVRQLLLASRDRAIGKKVGVESVLHIVGNRTAAKILEEIGDSEDAIAHEIIRLIDFGKTFEKTLLEGIFQLFETVKEIYDKTIKAFFSIDVKLANEMAQKVDEIHKQVERITEKIFMLSKKEISKENNLENRVYLITRPILWKLGEIAEYCSTLCEITINRFLEEPSELCKFEKIQQ